MIGLHTDTLEFAGDIAEIIRLFDHDVELKAGACERILRHAHREEDGQFVERCALDGCSITHRAPAVHGGLLGKRMLKRSVKTACFLLMAEITRTRPPWGSLTGIRPTRLMYEAIAAGKTPEQAVDWLREEFFVDRDKAGLLREIYEAQRGLIDRRDEEFDLYIGIPFCTTRCSYCSFASGEIGDGSLVEPYVEALLHEMEKSAELMAEKGYRLRAGYVGGGTPTAIETDQLMRLIQRAMALFPDAREWTVEAGRPDTLDPAKLKRLKAAGVNRISVNPQTFSAETLTRIGRAHAPEEVVRAYEWARQAGFSDINMDIIAALPGEDMADFERTLQRVMALNPQNVTVHTLAIKRSSRLSASGYRQAEGNEAAKMVHSSRRALTEQGYRPYYLYRQKYMAGNLENVGYAKPGRECLYNIDHMEETAPVLALGAGAITKWLFPRELRIERAPNVKNIGEYIQRVDEMVTRKRALIGKK